MKVIVISLHLLLVAPVVSVGCAADSSGQLRKENAHGWLGVSIQDVTSGVARERKKTGTAGVHVRRVESGSPAENAGIMEGDVIVSVQGKPTKTVEVLIEHIRSTPPGTSVSIEILREKEKEQVTATLGERPRFSSPPASVVPPIFGFGAADFLGLRLKTLDKQLGAYFGAPDDHGILVEHVKPGSNADKAGFAAGDVITAIGNERVRDVRGLLDALRLYKEGERVSVELVRRASQKTLSVLVDKLPRHGGFHYRFKSAPRSFRFRNFDSDGDFDSEDEFPLEMEDLKPELDRMKLDMDKFRRELKHELRKIPEQIGKELRLKRLI